MKIAVITDDFQTISAHFGRAQYYQVFTIQDRAVVHREARPKANHSDFGGEHRQARTWQTSWSIPCLPASS